VNHRQGFDDEFRHDAFGHAESETRDEIGPFKIQGGAQESHSSAHRMAGDKERFDYRFGVD
jgi:hypothetical protein